MRTHVDDLIGSLRDELQPYRPVADLLERVRGGRRLDVLEVGGRMGILRRFLPRDRVVLVDVEPSEVPGLVLGDGAALPFRSRSFDVVAAFDTLEHVPSARRAGFVSECARVSKSWIFLAGPYRARSRDDAREFPRVRLAPPSDPTHGSREADRRPELPERADVEARLRQASWRVASLGFAGRHLVCAARGDAPLPTGPSREREGRGYNS
jgi:hypothetical protein